ncbi:MAG: alpha-L-arabinofuranosidase C-terminal domain-containing protein [Thermoguttaceae bacterium]
MKYKLRNYVMLLVAFTALYANFVNFSFCSANDNLLPNPSFEESANGKVPTGWKETKWNGEGKFEYSDVAKSGKKSVAISSEKGADYSWSTVVTVNPYAQYQLSGWIKTEKLAKTTGAGALLNVHGIYNARTKAVTGDSDWTEVRCNFDTDGQDTVTINCLFGGWGEATGTAYFDDVSLTCMHTLPQKKAVPDDWVPTVYIQVNDKDDDFVMDELIYSQFIEHLGRCIYGGIWAEMLEDRKFWHGLGHEETPWYPVYKCIVEMDTKNPFVGEHTPKAVAPDKNEDGTAAEPRWIGVAQKGLAFKRGMKYPGYAWVKPSEGIEKVEVHFHDASSADHLVYKTFEYPVKPGEYTKIEFELDMPADCDNGEIEIAAFGKGSFHVGTASVMPGDNLHGMRADTLKLLKELDAPLYRWPGGNFVSGYDWKDGIGDRDKRPPRKNPAWTGVEHNDFGINEFLFFCKELGTEPYIAVNTGAGEVDNAVAELQYVNGKADTKWGKLRAEHGHKEPYGVKWWGIGNEMYGDWQIGHMPVTDYVKKHNTFVDTLRKEDPSIRVIGVGAVGNWDEVFLPGAAEHLDELSEHFYVQERANVVEHTQLVPREIKRIADAHHKYRKEMPELKGKDIRIAMDEWNYWYGPHVFGELGTRYYMKDALGIAAGLNEFARQADIYKMANYAQTVNVIGCIKTDKKNAQFETTGLVLALYRHEFQPHPVHTEIETEYASPLDIQATVSKDGNILTISVVNPLPREVDVQFMSQLEGHFFPNTKGRMFVIADPENDPKGFNDPAKAQRIDVTEADVTLDNGKVTVKPYSVTLLKFVK